MLVLAIATVIALGSGLYAGLGSTTVWRRHSLDATFSRLHVEDIRVSLLSGETVDPLALLAAVRKAGGSLVSEAEARLVVSVPASFLRGGSTLGAAGILVGAAVRPSIDRWALTRGRALHASDAGRAVALLDTHFAHARQLPPAGTVTLGGRLHLRYVGLALSPEYLSTQVTSGEAVEGPATRAVLFTSLATAQALAGLPGRANDAVIRVRPGANVERLAAEMPKRLAAALPGTAATVTAFRSTPETRALYEEITSEQRIYTVIALLTMLGAGFAAFNLTRRLVESQRREIGISMSLGVPNGRIVIRPFLFAAEITVIGATLGIAVGWAVAIWVLSVIRAQQPLAVWTTPFQLHLFVEGCLLALAVPIAASAYPIWRAVRVQPVDALVPPHLLAGRHRLGRAFRSLRIPGTITIQAPPRRILRAPTRSLLTICALALVIAPLLAALGATDSTRATVDAGERFLAGARGERLFVDLTTYQPSDSPLIRAVSHTPGVVRAAGGINIGGYLSNWSGPIAVSISMVGLHDPVSAPPEVVARHLPSEGIIISAKAAHDLHVRLGDTVTLSHPLRIGRAFTFVDSRLPVTAIDSSPYRFVAYMDIAEAKLMGLAGLVNTLKVEPRRGTSATSLQATLSSLPGVASVLPTAELSETTRDTLALIDRLFVVLQVVIGLLAFLVAFNTSNLATEERRRENATMFAFGTTIGTVLAMAVAESLILGGAGVGLGLGFGTAVLEWIIATVFPAAVPELTVHAATTAGSYLLTVLIGVAASAAAPVFTVNKLRKMSIPDALRYVE